VLYSELSLYFIVLCDVVCQEDSHLLQNYKPGLHRPGENYPELPEPRPSGARPKMVPEQLIKDYQSGAKNEVWKFLARIGHQM